MQEKGFQYSADVSQANKAMRWGVGLLGLELLGFIEAVFDTPLGGSYFSCDWMYSGYHVYHRRKKKPSAYGRSNLE